MIEPAVVNGPAPSDADALREVMRRFAAGVTVITACDEAGEPAGMTATAFTSVSLEPPIVLACMNASSRTAVAVSRCGAFAVNILAADQQPLAARFAVRSDDKFAGAQWRPGPRGLPILDGALATVACSIRSITEAGTHLVVLGDVLDAEFRDGEALVYLDGRYGTVAAGDRLG